MIRNSIRTCDDDKKNGCKWSVLGEYEDCASKRSLESFDTQNLPKDFPVNITDSSFQEYIADYYAGNSMFLPPKVQSIIPTNKNMCIVDPADVNKNTPTFMLSLAQSVVNMTMKGIARNESTDKGLLCVHSLGSGKTITAAGVMDAFWNTDRDIIFCSSVEGIANNPPFKFHEAAVRFFHTLRRPEWKNMSEADKIAEVATAFQKRKVRFMSFAQLAHILLISNPLKSILAKDNVVQEQHKAFLNNAILIIDEVHNIFKPLPTQKAENYALHDFLLSKKDGRYSAHLNVKTPAIKGKKRTKFVK
jgi:hypothetical protein